MNKLVYKTFTLFSLLAVLVFSMSSLSLEEVVKNGEISGGIVLTDIASWNHVPTYPEEFQTVLERKKSFNILQTIDKPNDRIEVSTTLLKKMINSTHQHSNGIKLLFNQRNLTVADLDKLTFEINIENGQLKIPAIANVINAFKLNSQQEVAAKKLFDNNAYLNFTLFGESADDQTIKSIYAVKNFQVPQVKKSTELLSITLNSDDFDYYWQQHWQRSYISKNEVLTQKVKGILIMAESNNGKTLSHYLPEGLPTGFAESFIEIPIVLTNPTLYIKK